MKTVIQRVKSASVTVDGQLISTIGKGLLVFAAIGKDDTVKEAESMASKVLKVKLWEDEKGTKWKSNVQDISGEVLCVSQFTLLASIKKNSPSFHHSASPIKGKELYDAFISQVRSLYQEDSVKDGVFQAMMDVGLVNDGPVGVDYRCDDEAVLGKPSVFRFIRMATFPLTSSQVTIEIDSNPPKIENPSGLAPPDESDTFKGHVHKKFELPASLME